MPSVRTVVDHDHLEARDARHLDRRTRLVSSRDQVALVVDRNDDAEDDFSEWELRGIGLDHVTEDRKP